MVEIRAKEQYNAWLGTVAADDADFEKIATVLGLSEEWNVLGFSVGSAHLPINDGGAATEAFTHLYIWAEPVSAGQDLKSGELHVTEFAVHDDSTVLMGKPDEPQSGVAIVLRSLKRTTMKFWRPEIANSDRSDDDIVVDEVRTLIWANGHWEESTT